MIRMNMKEKLNCGKAGAIAYVVSSGIDYLVHGGIAFYNKAGEWVMVVHKSLGFIDVFNPTGHGHLKNIDVFSADGWLFLVGMGSGILAATVMWAYEKIKSGPAVEKTKKGLKVKMNQKEESKGLSVKVKKSTNGPVLHDFQL